MNLFDALFAADNGLDFDCLDRLPEEIYIYNTERELLYLNKAAEARMGLHWNMPKGKPFMNCMILSMVLMKNIVLP